MTHLVANLRKLRVGRFSMTAAARCGEEERDRKKPGRKTA
jgi:hypothetical protein